MRILIVTILLNIMPLMLKGQQNLVPNWSFEDYFFCSHHLAQIDSACKEWFTPMNMNIQRPFSDGTGSSDYFQKCAMHNMCSVPLNAFGFQMPYSGNSYAGFALSIGSLHHISFTFVYKEYIEVELLNNLVLNHDYCISYNYSIINNPSFYYDTGIDTIPYYPIKLGVLLTDTIVKRYLQTGVKQPLNICATPTFETSLVTYKDTVNWIHVQGSFKAKGGERYLTIGNFECNPTDYNPDSVAVYIYIDDVRLYKCNPDSASEVDYIIFPNIFTPNGDGYNDKFEYVNQEQWEFETMIYNRWEVPVYNNKDSQNWDGRIDGNLVSSGVYFYIIKAKAIKTGEIRVYRGTVSVMY